PQDAVGWFGKAIQELEPVLQKAQGNPAGRLYLVNSHWGRAMTLDRLGRLAEALQDWERAVELDTGKNRDWLGMQRALTAPRLRNPAAAATAAQALSRRKLSGPLLHALARTYALASSAARQDAKLPAPDQHRLAEQYAAAAVQLLTRAHAAGHFKAPADRADLEQHRDFNPLRA